MLSLPVLILLAVIVLGALACVIITYRAHHSAASLVEQHRTAFARPAAFGAAVQGAAPAAQALPRRRRHPVRWFLGLAAATGAALYLWQSSAHAATSSTGPVLDAAHAPAQASAGGWIVLIVLAVVVLVGVLKPRHGRKNR